MIKLGKGVAINFQKKEQQTSTIATFIDCVVELGDIRLMEIVAEYFPRLSVLE